MGELIRGAVYKCVADLRSALSTIINQFYNAERLYSGLNYLPPMEYERILAN